MKRILTSAGLAATAVAGIQTTLAADGAYVDTSRWWHVSAAVRGFYDDNYLTAPSDFEDDSWGFEIRPQLDLNYSMGQLSTWFSALYSMRWYEAREDNSADHTVILDAGADYRFSDVNGLRVTDNFAWTEEPTLLEQGGVITAPLRSDSSSIRNRGEIVYDHGFSPIFGIEVGYRNLYYDYEEEGPQSYSALLDRMEHLIRAETRWICNPQLSFILGYWYEQVDFEGDDSLTPFNSGPGYVSPDVRDSRSHYGVLGADYEATPQLTVSVRAGPQYTEYPDLPEGEQSEWNGFGDLSASYEYLPGSNVRGGVHYGKNRTDIFAPQIQTDDVETYTVDQDTIAGYVTVNHRITERLVGHATGQVQYGEFNGGGYDSEAEGYYLAGLMLSYEFNQYLAFEAGYNYDRLDSDIPGRSFTRNRVFLGIRGTY
jgi:hypothetical protein